jgi:hypothetical protein
MYPGKMSKSKEAELKTRLQSNPAIQLRPATIQKVIGIINSIRTGQMKQDDWLPQSEGIATCLDILKAFSCEDFLTDEGETRSSGAYLPQYTSP